MAEPKDKKEVIFRVDHYNGAISKNKRDLRVHDGVNTYREEAGWSGCIRKVYADGTTHRCKTSTRESKVGDEGSRIFNWWHKANKMA